MTVRDTQGWGICNEEVLVATQTTFYAQAHTHTHSHTHTHTHTQFRIRTPFSQLSSMELNIEGQLDQDVGPLSTNSPSTSFLINGGTGVPDLRGTELMEYPTSFSAAPSKIGCGGGVANTEAAVGVVDLKGNLVDLILLRSDPVADAGLGGGTIGSGVLNRSFHGVGGWVVGVDDETAIS